jgi:hypothetical protein
LKRWWARQGLNLRPHPCEGWETGLLRTFVNTKTLEKRALLTDLVHPCISWKVHGLWKEDFACLT